MTQDEQKQRVAKAAMQYIKPDMVVGVGTGSTARYFIDELAHLAHDIRGAVPSSEETRALLQEKHIPILELNEVSSIDVYVDGADEVNKHKQCIKGGGGALTREKILASNAKQFVCIVDESKVVDLLGKAFALPVEVIDMARSAVARKFVAMQGDPEYREGSQTDNGHVILDIYNLHIIDPPELEKTINHIPGVIANGLFALRPADVVLVAKGDTVIEL